MGGEGSMMAANNSLKSNRAQLRRKEGRGSFSLVAKKRPFVDKKKASPELLENISLRIQKERAQKRKKVIILTLLLAIILVAVFNVIDWSFIFTAPGST